MRFREREKEKCISLSNAVWGVKERATQSGRKISGADGLVFGTLPDQYLACRQFS